jgi:hypothetical protein
MPLFLLLLSQELLFTFLLTLFLQRLISLALILRKIIKARLDDVFGVDLRG